MKAYAALIVAVFAVFSGWTYYQFPALVEHGQYALPVDLNHGDSVFYHHRFFGGDHLQAFYGGWKLKQALGAGYSILSDPFTFASNVAPNYDFLAGIQYITFAVMGALFGDILGYNLSLTVVALSLTFLFALYMARAVTRRWLIAIPAAVAVTMVPFHIKQMMGGHTGGFVYLLTPLFLGGIMRARLQPADQRSPAVAGLALFLAVVSDEHQAYYFVLASAFVFPVWGLQAIAAQPRQWWPQAAWQFIFRWRYLLLGLGAAVAYGELLERFVLVGDGGSAKLVRSFGEIVHHSVSGANFFKQTAYLNIGNVLGRVWLVVGLIWLALEWRRATAKQFLASPVLGPLLALPVCMLVMFGVGRHWTQQSGLYELLYDVLPYFAYQRVPYKIFGLVACLLILLTCYAINTLGEPRQRPGDRRRPFLVGLQWMLLLALAAQATVFLRQLSRMQLVLTDLRDGPAEIYAYLAERAGPRDVVMSVPVGRTLERYDTINFRHVYRSGARFAAGYNGAPPAYYARHLQELTSFNSGAPTRGALAYLKEHGISYLLYDGEHLPEFSASGQELAKFKEATYLEELKCQGAYCLYRVQAAGLEAALQRTPESTALQP